MMNAFMLYLNHMLEFRLLVSDGKCFGYTLDALHSSSKWRLYSIILLTTRNWLL